MKKQILRMISLVAVFVLALFFFSSPVSLADSGLVPCGVTSPCTLCHFIIGFHDLVRYGMYLIMALTLLALFLTGVTYIVSSGNEGLMTAAKGFLKACFIGFAVVFGGFLIVTAALWIVSAKGDLGIGRTSGWASFSCSTASSALNPVSAPAPTALGSTPGTAATAGTLGGSCGNNNYGRCEASLPGGGNPCLQPGKQWMSGGTNCGTNLWCCGNMIQENLPCVAMGVSGRCQQLYGTGGSEMATRVCPNKSWVMQQATSGEINCAPTTASGAPMGCCDMSPSNANTAAGIIGLPCGYGSIGTCMVGSLLTSCPTGQTRVGTTQSSCRQGLMCCGPISNVPTSFSYDGVSP